jgi:hypothetical protein
MTRLARVILAMVIDSYGVAHRSDGIVGTTDANFRMLRYCRDSLGTSPPDEQPAVGLAAHVDGSYLTVLFQNDVDGFELRTRNGGEWARVRPAGPDSLLVVAGQAMTCSTASPGCNMQLYCQFAKLVSDRASLPINKLWSTTRPHDLVKNLCSNEFSRKSTRVYVSLLLS